MQELTAEQLAGLFERLNSGGCPVEQQHGYKIAPVGLAIEKIAGISFNKMFDLARGGTGYAIELVLRNELDRPINIVGFQVTTPWGVPRLSLVPAPHKSSTKCPHYSFPEPGPYFDSAFVLNRFFARRQSQLNPGEEIEGVIVASSDESIPVQISHADRIITTLLVFDTRRNAFSAQFKLFVDRNELLIRKSKYGIECSERSNGLAERILHTKALLARKFVDSQPHAIPESAEVREASIKEHIIN